MRLGIGWDLQTVVVCCGWASVQAVILESVMSIVFLSECWSEC